MCFSDVADDAILFFFCVFLCLSFFLPQELHGELSMTPNLRELILCMLMEPSVRDATWLRLAMKGAGTDERTLV